MVALLLSGAGLAGSSGLNAYLPLLILALADRFSGIVDLNGRWTVVSSPWCIVILLIIMPVELIGDKIPRFDRVNDMVHMAIRPFAGAVCMASIASQDGGYNQVVAFVIGFAIAGAVHATKFHVRPAITRATAGIGTPIVSMVEDAAVVITSIAAVLFPFLVIGILPVSGLVVWKSWKSLQSSSGRLAFLYRGRK